MKLSNLQVVTRSLTKVFTLGMALSHSATLWAAPPVAPKPAPATTKPAPSGKLFTPPEDTEDEDSAFTQKQPGTFVKDEDQARRESPDLIQKFKAPKNAWGLGASIPELLTFDYFRLYNAHWGLHASLSPPVPSKIKLSQEAQSQSVRPRLQVATPAEEFPLTFLYGPHAAIDGMYFPFSDSTFYFSAGIGYRRLQLKGNIASPLLLCLVQTGETCDESTAFYQTDSKLHVNADYQSTSIMWRASAGWFKPLSRNQYLSIVVFGLTKAIRTYRHAAVDTYMDDELAEIIANNAAGTSATDVITKKSSQIQERLIERAATLENAAIPTISIGTGWTF